MTRLQNAIAAVEALMRREQQAAARKAAARKAAARKTAARKAAATVLTPAGARASALGVHQQRAFKAGAGGKAAGEKAAGEKAAGEKAAGGKAAGEKVPGAAHDLAHLMLGLASLEKSFDTMHKCLSAVQASLPAAPHRTAAQTSLPAAPAPATWGLTTSAPQPAAQASLPAAPAPAAPAPAAPAPAAPAPATAVDSQPAAQTSLPAAPAPATAVDSQPAAQTSLPAAPAPATWGLTTSAPQPAAQASLPAAPAPAAPAPAAAFDHRLEKLAAKVLSSTMPNSALKKNHIPVDAPEFKPKAREGGNMSRTQVSGREIRVALDANKLAMWKPNPRNEKFIAATRAFLETQTLLDSSDVRVRRDGLLHPLLQISSAFVSTQARPGLIDKIYGHVTTPEKSFGQFLCEIAIRSQPRAGGWVWEFDPEAWNRVGHRIVKGGAASGGKPRIVFE